MRQTYWFETVVLLALVLLVGLLAWFLIWTVEQANAQGYYDPEEFAFYAVEPPKCGFIGEDPYCGPILIYRRGLHREWWWAL